VTPFALFSSFIFNSLLSSLKVSLPSLETMIFVYPVPSEIHGDYTRSADHFIEAIGDLTIQLPRLLLEVKGSSILVNGKQVEKAHSITVENGDVYSGASPSFEAHNMFDLLVDEFR
jgi:hypothetical protein